MIQLNGRAYDVKFRNTSNWRNFKKLLKNNFEIRQPAATLQLELNSVKMHENEEVTSYSNRVEELFNKLSNAYAVGENKHDSKLIREILKKQTLVLYLKGLINSLKTIIKLRNPNSLEEAIQLARQEEIELILTYIVRIVIISEIIILISEDGITIIIIVVMN